MLTITLALIGVLQYVLVGERLERELIADQATIHRADARSIERTARHFGSDVVALDEVSQLLYGIDARPHITRALVADANGRVVASSQAKELGNVENEPRILRSAGTGGSVPVQALTSDGHGHKEQISYVVPVRIGDARYAFAVHQGRAHSAEEVAGVRLQLVALLVIGLVLAVVLFYVFGGRRVDHLYRLALDRSRRDGLTDLDNHRAFKDELERAVGTAAREEASVAIAIIDVDDFKYVNDQHGHLHGDRILVELAALLSGGRSSDRAFRLGGDEFALLLPGCDRVQAVAALQRVRAAASERLQGTTISVGFWAGETQRREPETLWALADQALYEAKRRGGDSVAGAHELDPRAAKLVSIDKVRAVRRLIDDTPVDVAFQPIWDIESDRVIGYEALARPRDLHGLAGPGEAFEVAERIGRAHELDAICLKAALAAAGALPDATALFLNLCPMSLGHDMLAGDALVEQVLDAGLQPSDVVLEITERSQARLPVVTAELDRLRTLGFAIALDDVGAGNAGLDMLRRIEVDYVKIDRSVTQAAVSDRNAAAVLQGIIAVATGVDAYVIAEGIEDERLLAHIRDPRPIAGRQPRVRGAQGYLLGRPAPLATSQRVTHARA